MDNIKEKVSEIVIKTMKSSLSPSEIKGADLIHEFGISSVDALEILIGIESEFGITIDDNDLSQELVSTLDNLVNYVQKHLQLVA